MLTMERVSRRFSQAGVHELDLDVAAGEIVALVGLNGAGKSTLMRLSLGMVRPDSGTVHLFGIPLTRLGAAQWRQVGSLVETPLAYPELTLGENLHVAGLLRGASRRRVEEAIDDWGLGPVAARRFRRLSLGTRQRAGLAAALLHRPRLLVLDEPGNWLDPASVLHLRDTLTRLASTGSAILVSSHHLDEMARIAQRILLMNAGRIIGSLENTGDNLERTFFDRVLEDDMQRGTR